MIHEGQVIALVVRSTVIPLIFQDFIRMGLHLILGKKPPSILRTSVYIEKRIASAFRYKHV